MKILIVTKDKEEKRIYEETFKDKIEKKELMVVVVLAKLCGVRFEDVLVTHDCFDEYFSQLRKKRDDECKRIDEWWMVVIRNVIPYKERSSDAGEFLTEVTNTQIKT